MAQVYPPSWDVSAKNVNLAEEKLQWLFKLYDKDMNGEIVPDEMEDIFIKMCKIVEKTELDHIKKHAKLAEEERKRKALGDKLSLHSKQSTNFCSSGETKRKRVEEREGRDEWGQEQSGRNVQREEKEIADSEYDPFSKGRLSDWYLQAIRRRTLQPQRRRKWRLLKSLSLM